jgi:hypothetical protein
VIALAVSYAIPIGLSLWYKRREVSQARWNCGPVIGPIVNIVALSWITFETVLFSMPTVLPVTPVTMNYASVVLCGFLAISAMWYLIYARKRTVSLLRIVRVVADQYMQITKAHPLPTGSSAFLERCHIADSIRISGRLGLHWGPNKTWITMPQDSYPS